MTKKNTTTTHTTTTTYDPSSPSTPFRASFDEAGAEIAAVAIDRVLPINIDITAAVITALGTLGEVRALRPRIVAELPRFEVRYLDRLETYTLALGYAHWLALGSRGPTGPIDGLVSELSVTRDLLVSDANALAKHGVVDGARLSQLQGGTAFRNIVSDVMLLVAVFRDAGDSIVGKTFVTPAQLDEAERKAQQLAAALGQREQAPTVSTPAAETRSRAFTLFMNAYDQVRRAATYLRWDEGDADTIVPSLYAGRGHRKVDPAPVPAPAPATPPPAALPGGSPFTAT